LKLASGGIESRPTNPACGQRWGTAGQAAGSNPAQ